MAASDGQTRETTSNGRRQTNRGQLPKPALVVAHRRDPWSLCLLIGGGRPYQSVLGDKHHGR